MSAENNNKHIFLITATFPYGVGETFLWYEIQYLAQYFEKVIIIPLEISEKIHLRELPHNAEVINIWESEQNIGTRLKHQLFSKILPWISSDFWIDIAKMFKKKRLKDYKDIIKMIASYYEGGIRRAYQILPIYKKFQDKDVVLYSYWGAIGAVAISLLKKKYCNLRIVSRLHGFDIYEKDYYPYFLPLRNLVFSQHNYVCPISEAGALYLKHNYNLPDTKIKVSRLGVISEANISDKMVNNKNIHIVSCSSIIPLKRVSLIAKAIIHFAESNPALKIQWTHIGKGDPNLEKELQDICSKKPNNMSSVIMGQCSIDEIYLFYKENDIHLFVNLSTTEGIPVSIMEAFSFAIPALATNVGGTSEIVNDTNGALLEVGCTVADIVEKIQHITFDNILYNQYSSNAYLTWQKRYNAKTNFSSFAKFLQNLN